MCIRDSPCPNCDHGFVPNIPQHHGIPGQRWGQRRLGLVNAAAFGLTVENATFINCTRTSGSPLVLHSSKALSITPSLPIPYASSLLLRPALLSHSLPHFPTCMLHHADDRPSMLAVGGFAKAMPPDPSGYDFSNAGAQETRFSGITWLQSNYRAAWRWNDEALYTDLDGTFADQPFCGAPNMGVGQNPNLPESTGCLLYTSPSPRDRQKSRMPSSA